MLRDGDALERTDLTPIVVLEPGMRIRLLQFARKRAGQSVSRAEAKAWPRALDADLASAHGVTKLVL